MRTGAVAGAAVLALALTGCVAAAPPVASESEIAAHNAQLLAKSWEHTGLAGEAPQVEPVLLDSEQEWLQVVFECMQSGAAANLGWEFNSDDGYRLGESVVIERDNGVGVDGGFEADPLAAQRDFYICIARYPRPVQPMELLTTAQLDYYYDYFQDSLVPCMLDHGYAIGVAPTRVEFHDLGGSWHPYWSAPRSLGGVAMGELRALCGDEYPAR